MDEYLVEMMLSQKENLSDEEIMIDVCRKMLHTNRKKKSQKEKYIYGKESNYNFYC